MKRTTKYVGLEVHQATTVASVRDRSGRVIARSILPTEEAALAEFFQGMRGAVNVAFEEGTQAQWLHDLLAPLTQSVTVCNLRGEARRPGNKADMKDADSVSRRLLNGDLRSVYHGSASRLLLPPGTTSRRGTCITTGALAEPEEASGRLAESQIEPWFASGEPARFESSERTSSRVEWPHAEQDAAACPKAATDPGEFQPGADRQEALIAVSWG